jgi:hypothetical protein
MRRTFQIFRKDGHRLWVEILVSVIALGLLTWTEWQLSTSARDPRWYNNLVPVVVVFLSWWFLVVRLIHGDALVGDRQFWVTRPYKWYELLAAKALFMIGCVGVPLLISQIVLLIWARAPVLPNLTKVILDTGGALLAGILPVAALAAITRNLSRWLVCSVVLILVMIGMVWLDSVIPNSHVSTGTNIADYIQAVLFASLTVLGITIRYARRHSRWGFVAIAAAIAALPIAMVLTPYRAIIDARFPIVDVSRVPFLVKFAPTMVPIPSGHGNPDGPRMSVAIPMQISELSKDCLPRVDGVMISIDLPGGKRWDSEWQSAYQPVPQDGEILLLTLAVDRNVYERVSAESIPVRLSVALSQYENRSRRRVIAYRTFELAEVGTCWLGGFGFGIECRSTASTPPLLLAEVNNDERTCPQDSTVLDVKNKISRSLDSAYAPGPLTPLVLRTFSVGPVCPGTPVEFSAPELVRRFRIEVPLGSLRLREFADVRSAF